MLKAEINFQNSLLNFHQGREVDHRLPKTQLHLEQASLQVFSLPLQLQENAADNFFLPYAFFKISYAISLLMCSIKTPLEFTNITP